MIQNKKINQTILLICPLDNFSVKNTDIYPSGALVLIGTILHNKGFDVKIVHMSTDKVGAGELKKIITEFGPDIIGLTINTFQTKSAREICQTIKQIDKNILIVAGGPHPSALKLKFFTEFPNVDIVVVGEGEHTFLEIVEGRDFEEIKGICYKNKIGEPRTNEPRPPAQNLDYIPLPNLDLVSFNKNRFIGPETAGALPSMYIMASRGCPFHCSFCNKAIWGSNVRFRKPELVIEEIKWLYERYGVKEIYFQDDTFNLNRKWAEQLLNLIISEGLNRDIIYKAPFRANEQLVDKELLQLVKRAGFWLIFYGVESGNQEMLDRMHKGLTIREIKRAFELTHAAGLKTFASFMVGLPGESKETIEDTFSLWQTLNPSLAGCAAAIPFPDTEFERIVCSKGHLIVKDYDQYSFDAFVVRTDALTREELGRYRARGLIKMKILDVMKKSGHPIANSKYFINEICRHLINPKMMTRRFNLLSLLIRGKKYDQ